MYILPDTLLMALLDGQISPRSLSRDSDPSARPSTLPIPRKQSPREAEGRPRRTSDPHQ